MKKNKGGKKNTKGTNNSRKTKATTRKSATGRAIPLKSGANAPGVFEDHAIDPLAQAQDLMFDAFEAPTRKQALALARKALSICPDCADAHTFLAKNAAKSTEEAIEMLGEAVAAGERALGKEAFKELEGHFWGHIETRPYMRARGTLADTLYTSGKVEEAAGHYQDMLRLNPNDNQGVRDQLMHCFIALDRDEDAEQLFTRYERDPLAVWRYSRALLDFRKHGDTARSNESLKAALGQNPHVASFLLGKKKLPKTLPTYHGFGDENEAVCYVHESLELWRDTPGTLAWLKSVAERT
ncbi:MAG: tetratricopeptide repeat protein [Desulfatibacillaceae bacterium]